MNRFTIVTLHTPPSYSKDEFLALLAEIMQKVSVANHGRIMMCGDFNAVLDPVKDTAHGETSMHRGKYLQEFIDIYDFTDVWRTAHPEERRYTSFHSGYPTRIDLILASPVFLTTVEDSSVGYSFDSDQPPVYVKFLLR